MGKEYFYQIFSVNQNTPLFRKPLDAMPTHRERVTRLSTTVSKTVCCTCSCAAALVASAHCIVRWRVPTQSEHKLWSSAHFAPPRATNLQSKTNPILSILYPLLEANQTMKRNHAVNADGFGLAYYDNDHRSFASLFKSVTPAWSDQNLAELCEVQYTDLLFAHVSFACRCFACRCFACRVP